MIRRNVRLRREYLYTKSKEAADRATAERKRKMAESMASGKSLPHELRHEADALRAEMALDHAGHEPAEDDIDSEYVSAGISDPRVLMTTSHDPSSKLSQFLKEMKVR